MPVDKEFIIGSHIDRIERERIVPVENDGIGCSIVNGTPVITRWQMCVAVALRRSAGCQRNACAGEHYGVASFLSTPGRFEARRL